ncbi:aldo/keto reductase [Pseudomonas aeruginosa]|nr:aldo/keto reductase [Pseudomonas aeruginosa]
MIDTPVSRIGLGTWAIGGWMWGGADDATSVETIRRAVESGINLIDTAPVYGFGHSEEVVGKALQGLRDKAVIAARRRWVERRGRHHQRLRRTHPPGGRGLAAAAETSIELSTCTRFTGRTRWWRVRETAGELERLRRDGQILAIGVSNYSRNRWTGSARFAPLAQRAATYNLFERHRRRRALRRA